MFQRQEIVLMVCTAQKGGMRTVVENYRTDGFFERWNVKMIFSHDDVGAFRKLALAWLAYSKVLVYLCRYRVRIVHLHTAAGASFWRKSGIAILAKAAGSRVIIHIHAADLEHFIRGLGRVSSRLLRAVLLQVDTVISLSQSWKNYILSIAPGAHVLVVENYVKPPLISNSPITDKEVVSILFLGVLGDRKGIFDLLRALSILASRRRKFKLIVGGNGEIERARSLAIELEICDVVEFVGWVESSEKEQLLRHADIYALPSYDEGLPMAILESMSWGIPVLVSNVGGIPELVRDEVEGLLVEPGNLEQIVASLDRLVAQPELRARLGSSARARILNAYSDMVVLPKLCKLYNDILEEDYEAS